MKTTVSYMLLGEGAVKFNKNLLENGEEYRCSEEGCKTGLRDRTRTESIYEIFGKTVRVDKWSKWEDGKEVERATISFIEDPFVNLQLEELTGVELG